MKKIKITLIFLILILLSSCKKTPSNDKIVTTFYPIHSLTEELTKQPVESIIEGGGDPHEFEPTARQRALISETDLFLYHDDSFEFWFDEEMLDKGKAIAVSEGIEFIDDDDHDGIDPHTWLDPKNAKIILNNIYEGLIELNPENEAEYKHQFDLMNSKLDEIISDYESLSTKNNKTFVVDHHAYGYLEKEYGLKQVAIIQGISDGDASFKETERAIEQIQSLNIDAIFLDPSYQNDVIDLIKKETGVEVLDLYTLEQPVENLSYLEALKFNYEQLNKGVK